MVLISVTPVKLPCVPERMKNQSRYRTDDRNGAGWRESHGAGQCRVRFHPTRSGKGQGYPFLVPWG